MKKLLIMIVATLMLTVSLQGLLANRSLAQYGNIKNYNYLGKLSRQYLRGNCTITMKPDLAVISGGYRTQAADPETAKQDIMKKIGIFRAAARKNGAKLILLERVRTVRAGLPVTYKNPAVPGLSVSAKPEFVLFQKFEIHMDSSKNIDRLTKVLTGAGMNHFGKYLNMQHYRRRPVPYVFYRFRAIRKQLEKLKNSCVQDAINNWCLKMFPAAEIKNCTRAVNGVKKIFQISSMRVEMGPVLRANSRSGTLYIGYPWRDSQLQNVELLGSGDVPVRAYVNIRVPSHHNWR